MINEVNPKASRRVLARLIAKGFVGAMVCKSQTFGARPEVLSIYDAMTRHPLSGLHPPVPGMLLSLYGRNLAASVAMAPLTRTLPPSLADVERVEAPFSCGLQYVSPSQINLWQGTVNCYGLVTIGSFDQVLRFRDVFQPKLYNSFGQQSNEIRFPQRQCAPRVMEFFSDNVWQPAIYQVRLFDGEQRWILNDAAAPALPGDWIVIFGVGAGVWNPLNNDNQPTRDSLLELTDREGADGFGVVFDESLKITPAVAVKAPFTFGVDQFNLQLPSSLARGRHRVSLSCTRWISPPVEFFVG